MSQKRMRVRLQRRDLPEEDQDAAPFGSLPGDVRLDEKEIGDEGTKTAQRGDESELSELFAQTQIERRRRVEMLLRSLEEKCVLHRQSCGSHDEQGTNCEERKLHSSFSVKTAAERSR